jgi:hypothetical protein
MSASTEDILAQIDRSLEEQRLLRQEAQEITDAPIGDDFLRERAATPVSRDTVNLLQSFVGTGAPNVAALAAGFLSTQVDARDAAVTEIERQRTARTEALQGIKLRSDIDNQVEDLLAIGEARRQAQETESLTSGRTEQQRLARESEARLGRGTESQIQDRAEQQRLAREEEARLLAGTASSISQRTEQQRISALQEERLAKTAEAQDERRELLNRLTNKQIDLTEDEGRLFNLSNQAQRRKKIISDQLQLEAARQGLDFDQVNEILQQRISNDTQLRALEVEVRSLLSGGTVTPGEIEAEASLREGERTDAIQTEGFDPFAVPTEEEDERGFFDRTIFGRVGNFLFGEDDQ